MCKASSNSLPIPILSQSGFISFAEQRKGREPYAVITAQRVILKSIIMPFCFGSHVRAHSKAIHLRASALKDSCTRARQNFSSAVFNDH